MRKKLSLSILLSLLTMGIYAQLSPQENKKGKFGYVNEEGEFVIKPQFDEAEYFINDIACVKKGNLYGFINEKGKFVVKPKYTSIDSYNEFELCKVSIGGSIDKKTDELKGAKYGFINRNANEIVPLKYSFIGDFDENGICWVNIGGKEDDAGKIAGGKYGYISHLGKELTKIQYSFVRDSFFDGYAWVALGEKKNGERAKVGNKYVALKTGKTYGYIDMTGKAVTKIKYDAVQDVFHDGMAGVKLKNMYGYVSTTGHETPINYIHVGEFSNGLGLVVTNPKKDFPKYGYINAEGQEVIKPQYDDAHDTFNEERSAVKKDGKWAIIDTKGNLLSGFDYGYVKDFENGMAQVSETGFQIKTVKETDNASYYWGFVNKNGNLVVPYKYLYVDDIMDENGLRLVGTKILSSNSKNIPNKIDARISNYTKYIIMGEEKIKQLSPQEKQEYEKAKKEYKQAIQETVKKSMDKKTTTDIKPTININSSWTGLQFSISEQTWRGIYDEKTARIYSTIGSSKVKKLTKQQGEEIKRLSQEATVKRQNREVQEPGFGWINAQSKEVIPCIYSSAVRFNEGIAAVIKDDKLRYINPRNETVLQTNYSSGTTFWDGVACVIENGKWGGIDIKGNIIVPFFAQNSQEARDIVTTIYLQKKKPLTLRDTKLYFLYKDRPQDKYKIKDVIPNNMWDF